MAGVRSRDGARLRRDLHVVAVGRINNQDVGLLQLRLARKPQGAPGHRAAFVEQGGPVLEKPGIIVGSGAMSFFTGANENAQRLGRSRKSEERDTQQGGGGEESVFH